MIIFRSLINLVLLTLVVWIAGFGVFTAISLAAKPADTNLKTDAIVVLTGGDKRIETGLSLLARGNASYLFISGVHADVTENEIRHMWKAAPRLPPCCIELGREAHTTIENAAETANWIQAKKFHSLRLVTANYHMNRALLEFHHALPGFSILQNPVVLPDLYISQRKFWILMFSEYNKTLFRYVTMIFDPEKIKD